MVSEARLAEEIVLLDDIGIGTPIKDELELGRLTPEKFEQPGEVTFDEAPELSGTERPRKGAGWYGRGPTLKPHQKGVARDFVDGAGLCSSGRCEVCQRRLPDDHAAGRLQKALIDGLLKCEKSLQMVDKAMDLNKLLLTMLEGWPKESPFSRRRG